MVSMDEDRAAQRLRDRALGAVAAALTPGECAAMMTAGCGATGMSMGGIEPADLLDYTTDHDMFLDRTEPFFDRYMEWLPSTPGCIFAVHAIILTGRTLSFLAVLELLQRAGLGTVGALTDKIVDEVAGELSRSWNLAYCSDANAPVLSERLAHQLAFHAMARLCVIRDRDGIDPLPS